jgi:hypothetical protein
MSTRSFLVPALAPTMAIIILIMSSSASAANVFRVDDSGSQPIEAQSQLRWKSLIPRGAEANEVETNVRVNIKLDVRPWQGRRGRIYMALPPVLADALKVEWTTQGRLQPGRLIAGGRGLVYQGPITAQILEDVMSVQISGDGRRISSPQRLQFYFEIEPE